VKPLCKEQGLSIRKEELEVKKKDQEMQGKMYAENQKQQLLLVQQQKMMQTKLLLKNSINGNNFLVLIYLLYRYVLLDRVWF
jgi:hypothetical protein